MSIARSLPPARLALRARWSHHTGLGLGPQLKLVRARVRVRVRAWLHHTGLGLGPTLRWWWLGRLELGRLPDGLPLDREPELP